MSRMSQLETLIMPAEFTVMGTPCCADCSPSLSTGLHGKFDDRRPLARCRSRSLVPAALLLTLSPRTDSRSVRLPR